MLKYYPLIIICFLIHGCEDQNKCTQYEKVKTIDSIIYRGGYVTFENGEKFNVGQPDKTIVVGSLICVKQQ